MGKFSQQRKGGLAALKTSVGSCVALIREKQRKAQGSTGPSGEATSRDVVLLGRLAYAWEAVAGKDLRRFVYPVRLERGRLTVICADSQWFQTLTYLKPEIQANIRRLFPDLRVQSIVGRLGAIPAAVQREPVETWSDWRQEPEAPLPDIGNPTLSQQIQTCRKKLLARVKELKRRGHRLCGTCGSNLVPEGVRTCSVCSFRARQLDLAKTRALLYETPWITYDEVREQVTGLQRLEFDAIRSDLLGEALQCVQALGDSLTDRFDGRDYLRMRYEMIRAVIFQSGLAPNLIDLEDPTGKFLLAPSWKAFLALDPEEPPC